MSIPAVTLLKLGGSLLTDKARPDTAREEVIARLAWEIACAVQGGADASRHLQSGMLRLVVGHGSGSFGHAAAARLGVHEGIAAGGRAVSAVQERAAALHRAIVAALAAAGLAPYSIAPSSAFVADGGKIAGAALEPLVLAVGHGMVPVVYGDVVMDRRRGCAICSTEAALLAVAQELGVREVPVGRALWAGTTAGVLDGDGRTLPRIAAQEPEAVAAARAAAGGSAATDVTGGMTLRLETALALAGAGVPSLIFDATVPGRITAALRGDDVPGTRVVP